MARECASVRLSLLVAAICVVGCTQTAAPEVHIVDPSALRKDPPLFVTAVRQKDEITHALQAAGFRIVDGPGGDAYLVRVAVGSDQRSQPCGTLNNVRYDIRRGGRNVIRVEAKGWTGKCEPNVFDLVSRDLRRRFVETKEGEQQ